MGVKGNFGPNWLSVTWSLAVEGQFYLLLPFLVRKVSLRKLPFFLIAFILVAPIFRLVITTLGGFIFTPARFDSLFLGALLACVVRNVTAINYLTKNITMIYMIFLFLLIGVGMISYKGFYQGDPLSHLWLSCLYATLILISIISRNVTVSKILKNSFLRWMGVRSYGIYLFHLFFLGVSYGLITQSTPIIKTFQDGLITVGALIATLMVAAISFRYIEKPITKFGQGFVCKNKLKLNPSDSKQ